MPQLTIERTRSRRAPWLLVALAWIVGVAALLAWLLETPVAPLREQLKPLQFWWLELTLVLALVSGLAVLRDVVRKVRGRDVVRITGLAAAAIVLTLFVAPRTNRIYYDEQIYQAVGQNLADLRLAQMCNDGNVEYGRLQCFAGEYNKQPYAYPHLLSVAYRLFGVHPSIAFAMNAIVMALTVVSVYLLVLVLFENRVAAFFSSLLLLLTPQQIIWSATAAAEPSAALASVVAVLCAAQFSQSRRTSALVATAVLSAYAAQFRVESLLILPIVALVLTLRRDDLGRVRSWWVALLVLALLALHIGHIVAVRNEGWGATEARMSLKYLAANLRTNGLFYLGDWRFPVVYTLLAAVGIAGRSRRSTRLVLGSWFLAFFAVFLFFYAGSYDYGADVRYSILTYAPLAVLGGLGVSRVRGWLAGVRPGLSSQAVLTAAVVFQFLWYAPLVRATTEEAWAARADVRFAQSTAGALRGNSYVLTHNPGMFHLWGVNAGQMSRAATDPAAVRTLADRYSGGVYLHWNFWCNVDDPLQREFCGKALAAGTFEAIREYRERGERFAFYRLVVPASPRR